jgi:hypothetical protein
MAIEEVIEGGVAEGAGEGGLDHDGDGGLVEELLKDLIQHRGTISLGCETPRILRTGILQIGRYDR